MKHDVIGIIRSILDIACESVVLYLEYHKELRKDKNFDCAYQISKAVYIQLNFGNVAYNIIPHLYEDRIKRSIEALGSERIEQLKPDAEYIANFITRYGIESLL